MEHAEDLPPSVSDLYELLFGEQGRPQLSDGRLPLLVLPLSLLLSLLQLLLSLLQGGPSLLQSQLQVLDTQGRDERILVSQKTKNRQV